MRVKAFYFYIPILICSSFLWACSSSSKLSNPPSIDEEKIEDLSNKGWLISEDRMSAVHLDPDNPDENSYPEILDFTTTTTDSEVTRSGYSIDKESTELDQNGKGQLVLDFHDTKYGHKQGIFDLD